MSNSDTMTTKNDIKKDKPLLQKPEENPLEMEIGNLIDREKTRRTIVSKMLNQNEFKKTENLPIEQ